MRFAHPEALWLAAGFLPALAVFLIWAWRKKQKLIGQFVQSRLLANLTVGVSQARQRLRLILLFLATVFTLLALARPQWGFDWEETTVQGLDIIVAIDTSKSMLATDVTPNRLRRAKLAALDLMKQAKSDRLGLIAFAGTAFLQSPLTLDEEAFRQSVEALEAGIIPQGGSAVAEAIDTAKVAFEKSGDNHKVLVIFTDGEDHDSGAVKAAEAGAKAGLKIFTIGVGTPEGEMLRVADESGASQFLKDDQGNAVKSRLNETLLREIATKASGFYLPLIGANPVEALYTQGLAPLPKGESTSKLVKNYRERYRWPLGIAMLLLIVEIFLPQRRRVRKTDAMTEAGNPDLKKAVGVVALLLLPLLAFGSITGAAKKYQAGQFPEALAEYQKLIAKRTNDFRLHFNAGDAAYKAGLFDTARKNFDAAINSPDVTLQQQAHYNLANTLFEIGQSTEDPKEKQKTWEEALKNYEAAMALNKQDADADHNSKFVKRKLEELKKQQQEQQQQEGDKGENEDKKEEEKEGEGKDQKDKQESAKNEKEKKDQQKKQDQQKQDSAKNEQGEQSEEEKQKQGQQAKEEQEKQKQEQAQGGKQDDKGEKEEQGQSGEPVTVQMTPQQALQFLEAQKQQDRTLIFLPPQDQKPRNASGPLKDW